MSQRAFQIMKGLGLTIVAGAITWLLSWFMQYVASITITPQHSLHLGDPATNRLALMTVVATVVVMVAITAIIVLDGCLLLFILFFAGASILTGIGSVAVHTFPGTTVTTEPAQWIYGIVVILWGCLMWYVFLDGVTDELAKS